MGIVLTAWIAWGALLAAVALLAWMRAGDVRGWIAAWQQVYGLGPYPDWILRADTHLHMLVACCLSLWFGVACRMFAPRTLPWLPLALTILVALFDEMLQSGSAERSFEWGDQAADAIGLVLSLPLLLLLPRLRLLQSAAASSAARSVRS